MDATEEMNNKIIGHSRGIPISIKCEFVPNGKVLSINRKSYEIFEGEFIYEPRVYHMKWAIKAKDWIFVLERMTDEAIKEVKKSTPMDKYEKEDLWFICAFHHKTHYNLAEVIGPQKRDYVNFIISKYLSVLYPEILDDLKVHGEGGMITLIWSWTDKKPVDEDHFKKT